MYGSVSPLQGAISEVVKAGEVKPVTITTKVRQGRKHITSVVGVESFAIEPEELAGMLQKKFAAAVSVQPLPGKGDKGSECLAQGALASKISTFLHEEFGVPPEHVIIAK